MRIKTFYARTMADALREIKAHLGPDALILSTKEIARRSGAWGGSTGFEVVAAVDDTDMFDDFSASSEAKTHSVRRMGCEARTYTPAGLLKRTSTRLPEREPNQVEIPLRERAALSLYQDLVACGVDASLATELLLEALDTLSIGQRRSRTALIQSMARIATAHIAGSPAQDGMPGKKVVAFVGPTGVGKTTSIAKLAARLALQKRKKVILMTIDGYRIGAIEQLRSYAGFMGIPFRFVESVSALPRAIEENSQRDYILIDTAGHGPKDFGLMHSLADFLKKSEFIERHLVLSAATGSSDLRTIMDRFEICHPDHLLFTKLDEASTSGPILNELVRSRKSFSYYSDGQKVPDDLHTVPPERIIDIVLGANQNQNRIEGTNL
ncbi:MAG: hypothetical protein GXX84_10220 [Acidobacteria bacterium]|nr:hypothetical protein [Acidobacteriota bacterium]